jgi:hypothetical protein
MEYVERPWPAPASISAGRHGISPRLARALARFPSFPPLSHVPAHAPHAGDGAADGSRRAATG